MATSTKMVNKVGLNLNHSGVREFLLVEGKRCYFSIVRILDL